MYYGNILFLIILGRSETTDQTFNAIQGIIIIEKLPKVGDLLNDSIIHRKQEGEILINSSQFIAISIVNIEGHIFKLAWDNDKNVSSINN